MRRIAILLAVCTLAGALQAQQAATPAPPTVNVANGVRVVHLIGLGRVPRNSVGEMKLDSGTLHFTAAKGNGDIAISAIENIQTADDSKRLVGGVIGTLSMFGPYGSGRFLSLFRKQIDIVTIEYRDANGGLHGAIFTMVNGVAQPLKDQLVAAGAKAAALPPEPKPAEEKK
jgi:hypothetical protein